jgi:hypothetical protein
MQQAHELSQQKLNFRQHYFIVAIAMAICYQKNVCGNKRISNATNYFLGATTTWTIATKVKFLTTLFHCGHKHAYPQPNKCSWQQTHKKHNE